MQAFEDFILAHPGLMRPDIWRWPIVFGTAGFAAMALFLVFKTSPSKEFLWASVEGKFFRLCWCVGIAAMVALAYDEWHHPEQRDTSNPLLVFGLFGLWFLLFAIAMVLGVSKALQKQRATKDERNGSIE